MNSFIFKDYGYDRQGNEAFFEYAFDEGRSFRESIRFESANEDYNESVLQRALFLAFLTIGASYYKAFPTTEVRFEHGEIDEWQVKFCNFVYQEGLSQFAFENNLGRGDLAQFSATTSKAPDVESVAYVAEGTLALQSGGKDSLLVAQLLERAGRSYTPWFVAQGPSHPEVLDRLSEALVVAHRSIDREKLKRAMSEGALNGHVPVTFFMMSYAVIQAILLGKDTILVATAHEGEEAHAMIGDLAVNHQWSKTWSAEQMFQEYVHRYISPAIRIGSPLRGLTELKVAQQFAQYVWPKFGDSFSSCNVANYQQGADNTTLSWCGDCPKCANSYLLFAPFIDKPALDVRLNGDLFAKPELVETFKGLLGIGGVMKPFECVGETDELRYAYAQALARGYSSLPFDVPVSYFDPEQRFPAQEWATEMLLS